MIVLAGMHASGVSLLADLLESAGVDLGRQRQGDGSVGVDAPVDDPRFVEFHDRALEARGAASLRPPAARLARLEDDEERVASQMILAHDSSRSWGWSDPRTTLFLPFWARALPDALFVLVYRHPAEVVLGLVRSGLAAAVENDPHAALRAWCAYNRAILELRANQPRRCVVVALGSVLRSPGAALELVAARSGVPLAVRDGESVERWRRAHPELTAGEIEWASLMPEAMRLYADLNAAADLPTRDGPVGLSDPPGMDAAAARASEHLLAAALRAGAPAAERPSSRAELERIVERQADEIQSLKRAGAERSLVEGTRAWRLARSYWELSRTVRLARRRARSRLRRALRGGALPPPEEIVVGCVAENDAKFLMKARRLMQSLQWFGGSFARARKLLCVVGSVDPLTRQSFERMDVAVRVVERFDPRSPHSNKLQFFAEALASGPRAVMLLDCDMAVVADPSPVLLGDVVQAAIADVPSIPRETLVRLFTHHAVRFPPEDYVTSLRPHPTILYCNSGFVFLPSELARDFAPSWIAWNRRVLDSIALLGDRAHYADQASLALALAATAVPFEVAPPALNFPLHLVELARPTSLRACDPAILHYHDRIDARGRLLPSSLPNAQQGIAAFNQRVDELAES